MRIHLDLLGGLAGDMFIAALLDAFPEHEAGVMASIRAVARGQGGVCRLVAHRDAVLVGRRFEVDSDDGNHLQTRTGRPEREFAQAGTAAQAEGHSHGSAPDIAHEREQSGDHDHDHPHESQAHEHEHEREHEHESSNRNAHAHAAAESHDHTHDHLADQAHSHTRWKTIRAELMASELAPPVLAHVLGIFALLAEAEAHVHGVAIDDVAFHEVGAWDSIADIVGAAHLIAAVAASQWRVSAIPLGFGRVHTAHGPMPVPAPATARLLAGFAVIDDGIGGERVTPTGAALIRYLCAEPSSLSPADGSRAATLRKTGIGFGTRVMDGISNCVRVLVFDEAGAFAAVAGGPTRRQLAVVEFEVDDQSAEDLSMGLEHLRAHAAVVDVVQTPVFGKKGRMMTAVRVLAMPTSLAAVVDACFRETTTIGLRHHIVDGAALSRRQHDVARDQHVLRVKSVERPGGPTAKTEADDVAAFPGHATRRAMRVQAEHDALDSRASPTMKDAL